GGVEAWGRGGFGEMQAQPGGGRMRHRRVREETGAKELALALVGAIDELVDEDEGAGRQLLPERAAGGERDEIGHTCALERIDVGAVVDVGGGEPMPAVVAGGKDHRKPPALPPGQWGARVTPGRAQSLP